MSKPPNESLIRHRPYWSEEFSIGDTYRSFHQHKLTPLAKHCCRQIAQILIKNIDHGLPKNYDKELKLLDDLPNFGSVLQTLSSMSLLFTNLSIQMKFNELFTKFGIEEPYNPIFLEPETSIIDCFDSLTKYFQDYHKNYNCTVSIRFHTFAKDIEKLPQFNFISSLHLYLTETETERVLRQWISYLKLLKGESWTKLNFLVLLHVPSAKLLYDLLLLIPSLQRISVGSKYTFLIENIPVLKGSLKVVDESPNLNDFSPKHHYFTFAKEVYPLPRTDPSSKVMYVDYYDRDGQGVLDFKKYDIIKPIAALKRTTSNSDHNGTRKRLKPRSNLKKLFGHKISK